MNTAGTSSSKFSDAFVIVPNWSAKRSVPVSEQQNIALKIKDNLLNNAHFNLLKRYKVNLSLPSSLIIQENHCSKKLLQIITKDDKILWGLITTLKPGRPLESHGFYMKNNEKDLRTRDDLFFLDNKIVIPAAARGKLSSMLHNSHAGQFGMKFLAEFIWRPHIYREIYHHGKSCQHCSKAAKNLKVLLGLEHMSHYRNFHSRYKINLDFAGPLDAF